MRFNFKKVASLLASTALLGSTIGFAAAANYPDPFIKGGVSNVAVVVGASGASSDYLAASDVGVSLQAELAKQTATGGSGGTTPIVSGEAYPLFTSGSPLLLNASLSSVRTTLGSSELPTVLKDGSFETTTNIGYEQRILIGDNPKITFAQQPTDDDDAVAGISLGTAAKSQYLYNATVTFDENVNFTHADSVGEEITLFGQKFTVGGATTTTKLVLLKSSQTATLSSDGSTSQEVTVDGKSYTIELVGASDNDARLKVTDSSGNSDTKTVSQDNSKTIQGVEVGVTYTNEDTARNLIQADVTVGASRITLQDGVAIKVGVDDTIIDGTNVEWENAAGAAVTTTTAIGKLIFQVAADDSQTDAIVPGQAYIDPIFGSFKVDFSGLTYPVDSSDREIIDIKNSGNDKMTVSFRSHDGSQIVTQNWIYNKTDAQGGSMDLADNNGDAFVVAEKAMVNQSGYVVLASDKEGGLYELTQVSNSSSTTASDDTITLKNVFTGESKSYKADTEGTGTFTVQGKSYTYTYYGASTISNSKEMQVRFSMPESSGQDMILFPSIKTSKGAKIAFYEPTTVSLKNWDGTGASLANVSNLNFQDGDGYTSIATTIAAGHDESSGANWSIGGTVVNTTSADGTDSTTSAVGKLTYNFTSTGTANDLKVYLTSPQGGNIVRPALIVFEEKDDANAYEASVVTLDVGYDGDSAGVGVLDVVRTWGSDGSDLGNEIQLESNNDLYQDMDIWGTLFTLDKGDSDQTTASISYPDNQVFASVYVAEESAAITSGGSTGGGSVTELGAVTVKDSEVSSVSGKNLLIVGGSCINTAAAKVLGSDTPLCGADFTGKSGASSGEFVIQAVDSPYSTGKVAVLVAGYNAADTTNAVKYLTKEGATKVDTTVGKKYKGTSATSATMVTT